MTTKPEDMEEKWKNSFKSKLENYEEPAPEQLWGKIEDAVKGAQKPKRSVFGRRIVFAALSGLCAAAVLLMVVVNGNILNMPDVVTQPVAKNTVNSVAGGMTTSQIIEQTTMSPEESKTDNSAISAEKRVDAGAIRNQIIRSDAAGDGLSMAQNAGSVQAEPKSMTQSFAETENETQSVTKTEKTDEAEVRTQVVPEKTEEKHQSIQTAQTTQTVRSSGGYGTNYPLIRTNVNKEKPKMSVSLSTSGLTSSSSESQGRLSALTTGSHLLASNGVNSPFTMDGLLSSSNDAKEETKVSHNIPIKVGALVKYRLSDRWAIESGLTYTFLSSDITSESGDYKIKTDQSLNFIGIPVRVTYDIWQNNNVTIYASAGGMAEKSVSGRANTSYYIGGKEVSKDSESVSVRQVQFSASAALGVQYNISKRFSLFVEPGVSYYFDNNSSVCTIYSDKPFNFNLQMGLRVSLK